MHHKILAAALVLALIGGIAGTTWWLMKPAPAPPYDEEAEYWNGVAMMEEIDQQRKAAEKRCGGPVEYPPGGPARCKPHRGRLQPKGGSERPGRWIGGGAIILPGVTIGDDAIVGAGSIVTPDVAAGSTVVGNPAREKRGQL